MDRGPEFGSVYFETLLTRYFVATKDRPAGAPRTGAVLERLFGTTTTQLLHQLLGNTQAAKHPRLMTREIDPRRLAVWDLSRFSARLSTSFISAGAAFGSGIFTSAFAASSRT